jgi:hypothetical protein
MAWQHIAPNLRSGQTLATYAYVNRFVGHLQLRVGGDHQKQALGAGIAAHPIAGIELEPV